MTVCKLNCIHEETEMSITWMSWQYLLLDVGSIIKTKKKEKWCKFTKKVLILRSKCSCRSVSPLPTLLKLLLSFGILISLANFSGGKKILIIVYYFSMCMYLLELIFFIAACVVLCFGSVTKTVYITHEWFWELMSRACTASRSLFFSHSAPQQVGCGWVRSREMTQPG